jgi:hypothetical protein
VNPVFYLLVAALIVVQFKLPRRFAFAPLLIAACHFQFVPVLQLGANFDTAKLVILAGLIRASRENLLVWTAKQPLDLLVALWAGWLLISGFAHDPPDHNPITIRLSQIYGTVGTYLYARAFLRNPEDYLAYIKCLALVITPLALLALYEKITLFNTYWLLGSGNSGVTIREGRVRAAGAFAHPILLGAFAATSLVLLAPLYRRHKRLCLMGGVAAFLTVFSSASSGPIVTLFLGLAGLAFWQWRRSVGLVRTLAIVMIIGLHLVMQAPVWYLMARIDLAGGSTGWHRAELITAALAHLGEWWLTGTDYTRHWIAYGIEWSPNHTDITNYYLSMGVTGGLPLMILFILMLIKSFQLLGRRMLALRRAKDDLEFVLWSVGAALFAHCFMFLSVAYFDQSYVPLMLVIGAVPGLCAAKVAVRKNPVTGRGSGGIDTPGAPSPVNG